MKKQIQILVSIFIIVIFSVVPISTGHDIKKQYSNEQSCNQTYKSHGDEWDAYVYWICRVDICGDGYYGDLPGSSNHYWDLSEGEITVKSIFSAYRVEFNEYVDFSLFGKYTDSGPSFGFFYRFRGKITEDPFEIHGFAMKVEIPD